MSTTNSTLHVHFNCIREHTLSCECWMYCNPSRKPSIVLVGPTGLGFTAFRPYSRQVLASASTSAELVAWAESMGIRAEVVQ